MNGQEGKMKAMNKLLEQDLKHAVSKNDTGSSLGKSKKNPSSGTAVITSERPMLASGTKANSHCFSETAKTLMPSPPKKPPRVKLAPGDQIPHSISALSNRTNTSLLHHNIRPHKQPKSVVPGVPQDSRCRDPDFLIMDRRHDLGSLICLPKEPDVIRTPSFVREGAFRFLDLPVELRLPIYEYLIQPEHYALHWVDGNQKSKLLTHSLPKRSAACQPRLSSDTLSRRRDLQRRRFHPNHKAVLMREQQHRLPSPVTLLWVCRQIYIETSALFYSQSTFTFTLLSTLRHFMATLTPSSKASLQHLDISHVAYGHPAKTHDQIWKIKADKAWEDLCWRIAQECPNISHLHLTLDYAHSKLQFVPFFEARRDVFGTDWMMALWGLCRLGAPGGVDVSDPERDDGGKCLGA